MPPIRPSTTSFTVQPTAFLIALTSSSATRVKDMRRWGVIAAFQGVCGAVNRLARGHDAPTLESELGDAEARER